MTIDNFSSYTNLVTQNNVNSNSDLQLKNLNSSTMSTTDFESVLSQYLTTYSNSKKVNPLAATLDADDSLIEELLLSASGRRVIAQLSDNHLMNLVTTSNVSNIKTESLTQNKLSDSVNSNESEDNFIPLYELIKSYIPKSDIA